MIVTEKKNETEIKFHWKYTIEAEGGYKFHVPPITFPEICTHCGKEDANLKYSYKELQLRRQVGSEVFGTQHPLKLPFCPNCYEAYSRSDKLVKIVLFVLACLGAVSMYLLFGSPFTSENGNFTILPEPATMICACPGFIYIIGSLLISWIMAKTKWVPKDWPWIDFLIPDDGSFTITIRNKDVANKFAELNKKSNDDWESIQF